MARPLRIEYEGALYHVTSRGDRQQAIFEDDAGRKKFLKILGRVVEQMRWRCHGYCLMDNHYHLILAHFANEREAAQQSFTAYVMESMGGNSVWRHLQRQIYLGDDGFIVQQ